MATESLLPLLDALMQLHRLDPKQLEAILGQLPPESADANTPELKTSEPPLKQAAAATHVDTEPHILAIPGSMASEHTPARETVLIGFGDDDAPLDPETAEAEQWSLPTEDEPASTLPESEAQSPPESNSQPEAQDSKPILEFTAPAPPEMVDAAAAEPSQFEWKALETSGAENPPAPQEHETDRRMRQVMAWSGKALSIWLLFVGSFAFGVWFLRPAPQPNLASKVKSSPTQSRESAVKRLLENKAFDANTALAREELFAAENAELAMSPPTQQIAFRAPLVPEVVVEVPLLAAANDNLSAPVAVGQSPPQPTLPEEPAAVAETPTQEAAPTQPNGNNVPFVIGGFGGGLPVRSQQKSGNPQASRGSGSSNQTSKSTQPTQSASAQATNVGASAVTSHLSGGSTSSHSGSNAGKNSPPSHSRPTPSSPSPGRTPPPPPNSHRGH
jgi:hypothetical protein